MGKIVLNKFLGLAGNPFHYGNGTTELETCSNLILRRDGALVRRPGLTAKGLFKTAGGTTFKGSRNGFYVAGTANKWFIGSDGDDFYSLPESGSAQAVVHSTANCCPYRITTAEWSDYIYGFAGYASSALAVASDGTVSDLATYAGWRQVFVSPSSSTGFAYGVGTTNYLMFSSTEYARIGGSVNLNYIVAPCLVNNTIMIAKDNGSLWCFDGVQADYSLKQVDINIGTPIPYSAVSTYRGVIFSTLDNTYLWNGYQLISLTKSFEQGSRLLEDFDTDYLWKAGSGYNPATEEYWITYRDTSGLWLTLVYNSKYNFWWEFVNEEFDESSLYNKGSEFYLSLDSFSTTPPKIYLYDSAATNDPNENIQCELETAWIDFPGNREMEIPLDSVHIAGEGWQTIKIWYEKDELNANDPIELTNLGNTVNPKLFIPGGLICKKFKIGLIGTVLGELDKPFVKEISVYYGGEVNI